MTTTEKIDRFLRLDEVLHITGLGRNTGLSPDQRRHLSKADPDRTELGGLASVGNSYMDVRSDPGN